VCGQQDEVQHAASSGGSARRVAPRPVGRTATTARGGWSPRQAHLGKRVSASAGTL